LNLVEEKQLWASFKERADDAARDRLILHYMRIVKFIAGRMAIHVPQTIEMNDLVGWGMLGLMDAVEKYDHRQEIKFTTYASIRIRGAIIDEIRSLDWAPRSLRSLARRVGAAKEKLRQQKTKEPSTDEVAEELGLATEQVEDAITQLQTAHVLSLDDYIPAEDNGEIRKIEAVGNGAAVSPDHAARQQERQEQLVEAILQLPDQQQKVLNLYYFEELTLKEIGAVLEVSESRICQVHSAAMKELRRVLEGVEAG
jgi:RNA polymerase sigma factor for flagellar operon FliA